MKVTATSGGVRFITVLKLYSSAYLGARKGDVKSIALHGAQETLIKLLAQLAHGL